MINLEKALKEIDEILDQEVIKEEITLDDIADELNEYMLA